MECEELRQELGEWRRGRLPSDRAQALERHLATCAECQHWEREEHALSRLLAERLPSYPAPAHLRRQIREAMAPRLGYFEWRTPAAAAVATALLMVLLLLPALPRSLSPNPLQLIIRAVLSEHTRSLLWGEPNPEAVPLALPRLMEETRIRLTRVFLGDDEVSLLGVEPVVLENRWGLAFYYKDPDDHMLSYLVIPGHGLSLPDRKRIRIDGFRPMLDRIDGFSVFIWKQEGLALFLISDLVSENDLARFRKYFLRIRNTTEASPIH